MHAPSRTSAHELRSLLSAAAPADRPALLDVRDEASFAAGHVAGSGNVPTASLKLRRPELPAPSQPVMVMAGEAAAACEAAEVLRGMGYRSVSWLDAPLTELRDEARVTGEPARLWRAAAFLAEVIAGIPRGHAADLASGSGRNAAFLALHGFEVEAWDHDPDALAMARSLAHRCGVEIETRLANLEARDFTLPERHYALVTCIRFLHRGLFPVIARALAPGGHLVYETFRVGQERHGHPRRARFLLGPEELKRGFETLGIELLRYDEPDPPGGPVTARLWGRRPE